MALEVLGSFLCTRKQHEWRRTIDGLTQNLSREILSQLRVSYDDLEVEYKRLFLDIACFFNKKAKHKVANLLKICGLDEIVGIKVLSEKSLLSSPQSNLTLLQNARERQNMHDSLEKPKGNTEMAAFTQAALEEEASKEYLIMHYLLQEMGRIIVFQESPINAGRRSRLWSWEDINDVLKENKGTEHVQSIILETQQDVVEADWDANCFSKMINLRMLDLSKVHLLRELESLPTGLKFLRWDDYNKHRLPSIDKLWKLETLQLCNSKIKKLWEGKPVLNKLRIIDMSGSECLSETPDFSETPNVEELLLNRCTKLVQLHESVGQMKNLVTLSLEDCDELETLPKMETDKLREFILKGCTALEKLPDFGQNVTNLYFLDVSDTGITQIPSAISNLTNLKILGFWRCDELKSLPADLPPHLSVCASSSLHLKNTIAQLNLRAPLMDPQRPVDLQGAIHIFGEFEAGAPTLEWFKCSEYCWGKDPSSGEFVTITANIRSKVVADSNKECWGIAVCLFLKSISQASQSSCVVWRFQDRCSTKDKTKMHGNQKPEDDWVVYVGFYPLDKKKCRPRPTDAEASQLDLSLSIITTSTARDLHDWEIRGCRWLLVRKVEFDEWREDDRAAAPSGHNSSNRERGESSHGVTGRHGKGKYEENLDGEGSSSSTQSKRKNEKKS